jgi:hypothetical protein
MQLIPFPLCEGLGEIHRINQLSRPTVGLTGLESNCPNKTKNSETFAVNYGAWDFDLGTSIWIL